MRHWATARHCGAVVVCLVLSLPALSQEPKPKAPASSAQEKPKDEGPADPALRKEYEDLLKALPAFKDTSDEGIQAMEARIAAFATRLQGLEERWGALIWHRCGVRWAQDFHRAADGERAFGRAEEIARRGTDETVLGNVLLARGITLQLLGRYSEALEKEEDALQRFRKLGLEWNQAAVLAQRPGILIQLGRYQDGLADLEQAAKIFAKVGDESSAAVTEMNRGVFLMRLWRFDESLDALERAQAIFEKRGQRYRLGEVAANKATTLKKLGRFPEALAEYERAESIFAEHGDKARVGVTAMNRGLLLDYLGRDAEAISEFDRALQLMAEAGRPAEAALAGYNRGTALVDMGRLEEGIAAIDLAAKTARESGDRPLVVAALSAQAIALAKLPGRLEEALARLEEAAEEYRREDDWSGVAAMRFERGRVLRDLNRRDEALGQFAESEAIAQRIGDEERLTWVLVSRAALHEKAGEPEKAILECARAAERVSEFVRRNAAPIGEESSLGFRRELGVVLSTVLQSLARLEKPGPELVGAAYRAVETFHGLSMAEVLAERGRLRRSSQLPEELQREHEDSLAELRGARDKLQKLLGREGAASLREEKKLDEETERAKGEVTALEGKLDRLVERLRLLDRAYTAVSYPLPASLAEVQSALPAGTALLEYAGANEDYGVFVITRGAVRAIWLGSATLVGTEVERVRELLGPQGRGLSPLDAVGRLRSLAKLVLDPALEALPASEDVRRLLIAPDWSLCLLPFEVLLVSEPKEPAQAREWPYLLRRYSVAYVHSGTALREAVLARSEQGPRHGARRFVAFAHPDYSREDGAQGVLALAAVVDPSRSGFAPLPGTAREALEAARLFAEGDELERIDAALESLRRDGSRLEAAEIAGKRFTLFLGSGAGEEALKARPEVKAASILHLACHGRADLDAPALSHLALAQRWGSEPKAAEDGLVTLRELRDLDLQAELVVLSACETNAGKLLVNEGVAGLSRAALAAGARAVVSTLWRVDDEPARRLVVSFYRRLLNERLSRAEALRRAKLEAIEAGLPLSTWSAYLLWDAGE